MASHAGGGLKSWGVYSEIPGATNNNIIATWDSERSTKLDAVDDNALTCKFGEADPSDITMLDLPLAKFNGKAKHVVEVTILQADDVPDPQQIKRLHVPFAILPSAR